MFYLILSWILNVFGFSGWLWILAELRPGGDEGVLSAMERCRRSSSLDVCGATCLVVRAKWDCHCESGHCLFCDAESWQHSGDRWDRTVSRVSIEDIFWRLNPLSDERRCWNDASNCDNYAWLLFLHTFSICLQPKMHRHQSARLPAVHFMPQTYRKSVRKN